MPSDNIADKPLVIVENSEKYKLFKELIEGDGIFIENTSGSVVRIADSSSPVGWRVNDKTKKIMDKIKDIANECDCVYLAMDDDADGERLAWDIIEYIQHPKAYRITPKELTKEAILEAIAHGTRKLDQHLINGYNVRKIIESIVSKNISEMMRWFFKKEEILEEEELKNLGIGRVSASALALIVQAEEKIDTFIPEYYKRVSVDYFHDNMQFSVRNKLKFTKDKKEELMAFIDMVKREKHVISKFEKDTKDRVPPPPLNAAWLQRAANYQFQYSAKQTMQIAKELYQGIEIHGKRKGLITYSKTNSLFFSDEVIYEIIQLLLASYGEKYTFTTKRVYKGSDKNTTQEAIRPISFEKEFFPKNIREFLTEEQFRLYEYIYLRTIATQMTSAIYDQSELIITAGGAQFKAIANHVLFDGWELIGKHWKNDEAEEREEVVLPEILIPSDILTPLDIRAYEIKERSPWRYGEGRFITSLEKYSIANASFISEITNFLETKGFIEIINGMLYPTEFGKKVYYFLKQYVPWLIDLDYVAKFEQDIIAIQKGEKEKTELIAEYEQLKNEAQIAIGYGCEDGVVEEWIVEKSKRIAKQKNIKFPTEAINDRKKLLAFINQHKENLEIIGKCPACKSGQIYGMEHGYKCNDIGCSFVLWNNSITRFFNNFSKNIPDETLPKYMEILFKKGKLFIDNLYSPKKEKFFDAFITINYDEGYHTWGLGFAPKNEKDDNKEEQKEHSAELGEGEKDIVVSTHMESENKILKAQLQKEQEERRLIIDESKKDALTRAFNRRCFDTDIEAFMKNSSKEGLTLAFIDGDKFKNVNDTYGHQAGDKVLQAIVNAMIEKTRELERARVYRYGGEEFLILFVNEDKKNVLERLNKIRVYIENNPVAFDGQLIHVTISSGVSFCTKEDTVATFINRADEAVYRAKENGRNRIEIGVANVAVSQR